MSTKILVINDSPQDIFSKCLSGAGFEVIRQSSMILVNSKAEDWVPAAAIILVVNRPIDEAVKVKQLYPARRVVAVNGGEKDFQPFLTVIYGENDYDYYNYSSWLSFQEDLFQERPRQIKPLKFQAVGRGGNYYTLTPPPSSERPTNIQPSFAEFISVMTQLSRHYLNWLQGWIDEIAHFSFPVDFPSRRKNKKIKRGFLVIDNNFRGLPIFKEGDPVFFYGTGPKLTLVEAKVLKIENQTDMTVIFNEPLTKHQFAQLDTGRPDIVALMRKVEALSNKFRFFEASLKERLALPQDSSQQWAIMDPVEFLTAPEGDNINLNIRPVEKVFLSGSGEKILRDISQSLALADILSRKFINIVIGPAGTGKTFLTAVAVQQIIQAAKSGKVVLVASHSNLGVDNLVAALAEQLDPKLIFRLGHDPAMITAAGQPFHNQMRQAIGFFTYAKEQVEAPLAEKKHIKSLLGLGKGVVLACTLDSYLTLFNDRRWKLKIDVVVVDEASRGLMFEFIPLIQAAREKVVFIGDNRQLGNISLPQEALEFLEKKMAGQALAWPAVTLFNKGFFNALIELGYIPVNLLNHNRRSLTKISQLVSQVFYDNQLVSGRFNPYKSGAVEFFDTYRNEQFKEERAGTSFSNPKEAAFLVKQFVARMVRHVQAGGQIVDGVVISPYRGQVRLVRRLLRKHLLFHTVLKTQVSPENIDDLLEQLVITVDAIQGGQRKLVFVSLVRSNNSGDIGFNHDIRRINVALSRAQEVLSIIGNSRPFLECAFPEIQQCFKKIIKYAQVKGVYKKLK